METSVSTKKILVWHFTICTIDNFIINVRNLDHAIAQQLAADLACDLSPENLTCDGELDRHTVQQRAARYRGALRELQQRFNVEADLY